MQRLMLFTGPQQYAQRETAKSRGEKKKRENNTEQNRKRNRTLNLYMEFLQLQCTVFQESRFKNFYIDNQNY